MAEPGSTTQRAHERLAGSLLQSARQKRGWSMGRLAVTAGVPTSTVARIEAGDRQPSLLLMVRLLAAADLDLRVHLEPYDDHDDVLDARQARRSPAQRAAAEARHERNGVAFRGSSPVEGPAPAPAA